MPSFHTPGLTVDSRSVEIGGDEHHHIAHVKRLGVGDSLLLTSGEGVLAEAVIERMGKRSLRAAVTAAHLRQKSRPRLACAFSLLRSKHDHLIVEKLTELGAAAFFPFSSAFTVRQPGGNTTPKFEAVAVAAMKQCDGAFLPCVAKPRPLPATLEAVREAGYTPLVASEIEQGNILPAILPEVEGDICLVVGPEGGWSPEERAWFAREGLRTVSLGNHILRAETAAIAGMGMLVGHQLMKSPDYY